VSLTLAPSGSGLAPYPPEFRRKVVELARAGRGADELASEFQLASRTVRDWIKRDDLDFARRSDGLTAEENAELSRLRHEVQQL